MNALKIVSHEKYAFMVCMYVKERAAFEAFARNPHGRIVGCFTLQPETGNIWMLSVRINITVTSEEEFSPRRKCWTKISRCLFIDLLLASRGYVLWDMRTYTYMRWMHVVCSVISNCVSWIFGDFWQYNEARFVCLFRRATIEINLIRFELVFSSWNLQNCAYVWCENIEIFMCQFYYSDTPVHAIDQVNLYQNNVYALRCEFVTKQKWFQMHTVQKSESFDCSIPVIIVIIEIENSFPCDEISTYCCLWSW